MNQKNLLFLLLILISTSTFSQNYTPIDTADFLIRQDFLERLKEKNEVLTSSIKKKYRGKTKNELAGFYEAFFEDFENKVKNKDFTFNSDFEKMANDILIQLKKNNSQIPDDLKVLVAKDNIPNAYCLPDGTFVVNMGLFNWMDNEDQVASILSHEIAHKMLEHSFKRILKTIEEDKADRLTLLKMKNMASDANKSETAFELVKNRIYKKGEKRRHQEVEADSLGYLLFENSGYKKEAFVNAMNNIKNFDTIPPRELKLATYKKLYDLPDQPFNEKWLKKEDFSLYNYDFYKEKVDRDSVKSHPEMHKRIEILQTYFPELQQEIPAIKANDDFLNLQYSAGKEILPNIYHSEDYGLGIYVAMQYLQDNRSEDFNKYWLGRMFEKIFEARKNYNLNRYLDRVNPKEQSESYQQFLNFMWNLSVTEIKYIADYYQKETL